MSLKRAVRGATPWQSAGSPEDPREPLAPRQLAAYVCARGHDFTVTFAAGINVPVAWDCRCGRPAGLTAPEAEPTEHERRMLQVLGRRTRAEGEQILADRLNEMRTR